MKKIIAFIFTLLLFGGCYTLDKYAWQGAPVLKGEGGAMRIEDNVEIWVSGEPSRYYIPLEYVVTETTGTIGVQSYLFGVLIKQSKKIGADGFILLSKDADVTGSFSTGSLYGVANRGIITGSTVGVSYAVKLNTYKALLFKYATEDESPTSR